MNVVGVQFNRSVEKDPQRRIAGHSLNAPM